uniref:Uncharacterized protein n=1 Tax=Scophthalmus maximus TaxID=52904 RepID=A0A8D3A5R0_SCOMX
NRFFCTSLFDIHINFTDNRRTGEARKMKNSITEKRGGIKCGPGAGLWGPGRSEGIRLAPSLHQRLHRVKMSDCPHADNVCSSATHVVSLTFPGTSHCHGGLTCHLLRDCHRFVALKDRPGLEASGCGAEAASAVRF